MKLLESIEIAAVLLQLKPSSRTEQEQVILTQSLYLVRDRRNSPRCVDVSDQDYAWEGDLDIQGHLGRRLGREKPFLEIGGLEVRDGDLVDGDGDAGQGGHERKLAHERLVVPTFHLKTQTFNLFSLIKTNSISSVLKAASPNRDRLIVDRNTE